MKAALIIVALFQLFLIWLKISDVGVVGEWSWWLVMLPTWIVIAYVGGLLIIVGQWEDDV